MAFLGQCQFTESARVICGFLVHTIETVSHYSISQHRTDLIQLHAITCLENQTLHCIQPNHARYTDPALNKVAAGKRNVSMFDTQMIQHACQSIHV